MTTIKQGLADLEKKAQECTFIDEKDLEKLSKIKRSADSFTRNLRLCYIIGFTVITIAAFWGAL